ncbi:hypothetical protein O6H91_05G044000 [Diphasiastrum complanatum]|uniref:Uncharacterized protein n=2 Tax=Diphasiastrum complanatum TaxID=34168 RepID=A0ACC2DMN6_DIPCM|nr:hypothetical protein O6H91_05G043000 [Diphasiastrum complanatum]KAJ7555551.1 hypothetical protein O6H91_05G044000 [Diphasiastrum complanatum]
MEHSSWSKLRMKIAVVGFLAAMVACGCAFESADEILEIVPEVDNDSQAAPAWRIDLTARDHSACQGMLESRGDILLDRVHCALKKGATRLHSISLRKSRRGVVNSISQVTSCNDFETDVAPGGGDYVGKIALGTPAKTFSVIVDTGSDLVWIQCNPCSKCFKQPEPLFNPDFSYSYSSLSCSNSLCKALPSKTCSPNCQYSYFYGDGSGTRGNFATETITLAKTDGKHLAVRNFAFGCGHRNSGTFSDASGLMGLGRGPVSFPSQLGSLFGHKFSYCLVTWTDATSKTSPMFFGDAAVPKKTGVRYTPLLKNPNQDYDTFYYVQLDGISVAGSTLSIPHGTFDIQSDGSGGVIFDSGTTLTYLATAGYQKVLQALKSHISLPVTDSSAYGLDLCYAVSHAQGKLQGSFPRLTFHFRGADYELPLENYFIPVTTAGDVWCLALAGSSDFSIFGNIQQQNFHIFYDLGNSQIGFVPTTCASA